MNNKPLTTYDKEFFRKLREDRNSNKAKAKESLRPHSITALGHKVKPEEILKFTKKGTPSQQSHMGKIYTLATNNGWDVALGKSEYFTGDHLQENGKLVLGEDKSWTWIEGVKDKQHFMFNENGARLGNRGISVDELFKILIEEN